MDEASAEMSLLVLLVGAAVVVAMLGEALLSRFKLPGIVFHMLTGFGLRLVDERFSFLSPRAETVFELLASLGVIVLLFRVGLESDALRLVRKLKRASPMWLGSVALSGGLGFAACYVILGYGIVPSLAVAISLTATSVGIPAAIWQEKRAIASDEGDLFLDVAELDDVSGIVLMVLLFSLLPAPGAAPPADDSVAAALALLAVKLVGFVGFCWLFARFAERRLARSIERIERPPHPMLTIAGIGIVIAGVAGFLGFSVAIGAFFAGLVFSRDPHKVRFGASFNAVHDLFAPFFFIGVGMQLTPSSLGGALLPALVLLVVAVVGKVLGTAAPALLSLSWASALTLGVSMVPRAEISLIIAKRGAAEGGPVSPELFSALVLVSAVTCLVTPIVLGPLLERSLPHRGGRRRRRRKHRRARKR